MLELSCFRNSSSSTAGKRAQQRPMVESVVKTSDGQLRGGGLQHDLLLPGKAELCLS